MTRASYHLTVLGLLGVMTVGGLGTRWDPETARAGGAPSPVPIASSRIVFPGVPSVQAAPRVEPSAQAASRAEPPARQLVPKSQPISPTPKDEKPLAIAPSTPPLAPRAQVRWVQNFRPTELFAGPEPGAPSLGQAPQFSSFHLLETGASDRLKLFDPGKGNGTLPRQVWASSQDFGPAGSPRPEFELAAGGGPDPRTNQQVPTRVGQEWPTNPTAELAVALDGESGGLLYGKDAHKRLAPASLTKIMTAIVAIERGNPQDKVAIDVDSRTMWESTVMGLTPGESLALETLLYGLMLPSGNDAALAIARHVGGSEARFVDLMNEKVKALGLQDTQFRNPHGLDAEGHYSSAYDMAIMARYAMQSPLFQSLSGAQHWQAEGYDLWNLNKLLGHYPGADGVKVGFTDNAGRCLVASATRDGHRVFVTVIRSHDPAGDSRALLDYAFQNFKW
jgi:hypothetical protein